ncbi:MAG: SDR family oxidoreductase [Streptosporangiaceae bacterium]
MTTANETVVDTENMVAVHTLSRRRAAPVAMVSRPELWERLGAAARVTAVSAPPGSGKTVLLRFWISAAGLAERAAWVTVGSDERDPQRLWLAVLGALRQTASGSALVRPLTAAPDLDGWAIVERLLTDLAPLQERIWLVIDDAHELGPDQVLRQLELLVMRAPAELRFVLGTRHDLRLGLHRLRLEGELTEIREPDLRFTADEAEALFQAAGVELPGSALALLMDRTEGWAAGLRLAALSLAGHPDPARFAEEFSGTERTVAEYLLAEVLDRQPAAARRLLLRTSVLERVNGELADLLTGGSGGERVLQDLEEANAFVVSLDVARSWFRYHHLFAGLLQLEQRTASARARGRLADLDRDAVRLSFDTKVIGPLMLAKHLAPRMNEGGSFVIFSGVAAAKIAVGTMGVAITNAAADTLARSLALELALIRVNAISPGVIDTGAWDAFGEQGKADYFADISARNPTGRIGTTDDIADAVLFVLTSTFLTGQTLHIDGGEPLT